MASRQTSAFFIYLCVVVMCLTLVLARGGSTQDANAPVNASFNVPFPGRQDPQPFAATDVVFEPGLTIARVGDQHIFRGDLLGEANLILAPVLEKIPALELERQRDQIDQQREALIQRQLLEMAIQRKLLYVDFLRAISKMPEDKRKEVSAKIQKSVNETFGKNLEKMRSSLEKVKPEEYAELFQQDPQLARLAMLMREAGINRESDLEELLRRHGSSMAYQTQIYMERELGKEARSRVIDRYPVITHEQMLAYYREHLQDFTSPAKARWEQLSVQFDKFPTKFDAGQAIMEMANDALYGGSFSPVAKSRSQEPNAGDGGVHDWLSQGALKSKPLDQAIFSLPIGKMSYYVEDDTGVHIVRVLERREAIQTPFTAAQETIREKLRQEKLTQQLTEYLEKLRKKTPIWTIYEDEQNEDMSSYATPQSGLSSPNPG